MLASNSMFSRRVVLKAGVLIASILHRGFCANPGAPENRLTSRPVAPGNGHESGVI